jgi:hypothetical protein
MPRGREDTALREPDPSLPLCAVGIPDPKEGLDSGALPK